MEFDQPKGIYQQIADQICDQILESEWVEGDRIPSIRDLAISLGVNPNTVTRSYQELLEQEIIENRRGIGYFVAPSARNRILKVRRAEFISEQLPRLLKTMELLEIDIRELDALASRQAASTGGKNQ